MTASETTATTTPFREATTLPPAESPWRRTLRRFLRHRLAVIGLVIIVVLVVLALTASEAAALKQNLAQANKPPSPEHVLGTDRNGRDVLARTLRGRPGLDPRRPRRGDRRDCDRHGPRRDRRLLPARRTS